jgi:hypothetical protein
MRRDHAEISRDDLGTPERVRVADSIARARDRRPETKVRMRPILGGLVMSFLLLGGCYLPSSTVQAPPPPPAAPTETLPPQPGPAYVWVPGSHVWQPATRAYVWVPGYWTIPPQGYAWVPGHWETRANGTVWIDGQWRHN